MRTDVSPRRIRLGAAIGIVVFVNVAILCGWIVDRLQDGGSLLRIAGLVWALVFLLASIGIILILLVALVSPTSGRDDT